MTDGSNSDRAFRLGDHAVGVGLHRTTSASVCCPGPPGVTVRRGSSMRIN